MNKENQIKIEVAEASDAEWIKKIYSQCKKELGSFNLFYCWDRFVSQGEGTYKVIREQAFVRYKYSKRNKLWVLHDIGVDRSARGLGLGLILVKEVPTPMVLKCNCDNINGNKFYESIGMTLAGTTKTRSGNPQNVWQRLKPWEDKQCAE